MAADYLVSQLQPLTFDGPAPYTLEKFDALCKEQLGPEPFVELIARWADLETQLRNTIAEERARLLNQDPAPWRHPATGCALHWQSRVRAAFAEKDPARRETLLDRIRWDAAAEMTPVTAPLSRGAAFTYRLRLEIVLRRQAISVETGNTVFDHLLTPLK